MICLNKILQTILELCKHAQLPLHNDAFELDLPKTAKRFEQRKATVRVLTFGKSLINVQLLVWDKWAIPAM